VRLGSSCVPSGKCKLRTRGSRRSQSRARTLAALSPSPGEVAREQRGAFRFGHVASHHQPSPKCRRKTPAKASISLSLSLSLSFPSSRGRKHLSRLRATCVEVRQVVTILFRTFRPSDHSRRMIDGDVSDRSLMER